MKRSEMVDLMWKYIQEVERDYDYYMEKDNASELLLKIEQAGMLPPVGRCVLIPDPSRPGSFKHSEVKREWDKE